MKPAKRRATIAKSRLNVLEDNPYNALHIAALESNTEQVRDLLGKKAYDIDTAGERGFTALHFAANSGALEICQLLLDANADFTIRNEDGLTAVDLLTSHDFSGKTLYEQIIRRFRYHQEFSDHSPTSEERQNSPQDEEETNSDKAITPEQKTTNRRSQQLQRTSVTRSTQPRSNFAKSVSTGDLLHSIKKETISRQRSKTKSQENIAGDIISTDDSESTSDSAKVRSSFIHKLSRTYPDLDTGSSEFGDSVIFVSTSDFETEMEQRTPTMPAVVHDTCLDSKHLRTLTRNVSDVMNLISATKMVTTNDSDIVSFPEFLPPRSLAYTLPQLKHSSNMLSSVKPERLLKKVLAMNQNSFTADFLSLYLFFITQEEFHNLLQAKFMDPGPVNQSTTRMRILKLYTLWLSKYFRNYYQYPDVLSEIHYFVESVCEIDYTLAESSELRALREIIPTISSNFPGPDKSQTKVTLYNHAKISLEQIPPNDLAVEITLKYSELLSSIGALDFALFRTNKEIMMCCPAITKVYEYNDKLKRWIISHILLRPSVAERAATVTYFVRLLEGCMRLKNYQVSWIIAQALLSNTISKMDRTWDNITNKVVNEFKSMLNALTQSMNYEIFAFDVYKEHRPIVYNIDIVLQEFISRSKLQDEGKIDFQKLRLLSHFLKQCATLVYEHSSNEQLSDFISDLWPLSNKFIDIYAKSHEISREHKQTMQFFYKGILCKIESGKFSAIQGSIEEMISLLIDDDLYMLSDLLIEEVLLTHHHYISSVRLLETLLNRFAESPSFQNTTPSERLVLHRQFTTKRSRILYLIRYWFSKYGKDLLLSDQRMESVFTLFLKKATMLSFDETFFFTSILQRFSKKNKKISSNRRKIMVDSGKQFSLQSFSWSKDLLFKSSFPKLAAKQFCLIDSALYSKIAPSELLADPEEVHDSPNRLQDWVNRFNSVSNWTSCSILEIKDLHTRTKILKQFIKLARECLGMKNFNTCYAIISGLNHSSVQRLTKTWKGLSPQIVFYFQEIEKVFDLKGGYKTYRNALKQVEPPIIPFLGVYTKDVYLLQHHNDTFKEDGSINFEKFSLLVKVIHDLIRFQSVPYHYDPDPVLQQYLRELSVMDEEMLYACSTKIEPLKPKPIQLRTNPVYGQVVSPRGSKDPLRDSRANMNHIVNEDGEQVTKVINPLFNHPELKKTQPVKRTASEPNHSKDNNKAPPKPKRSISRIKFRRSKIGVVPVWRDE